MRSGICGSAAAGTLVASVVVACIGTADPSASTTSPPTIAGVTCEGVALDLCRAAHADAITNGLFLDPRVRIVHAVVRPTAVRIGSQDCAPLVDVSFRLDGRARPLVVTVGRFAGRLTVCTY